MACTLTISLLSESQEGDIGDDWKYTLEAQVFSGGLTGEDSISVAKHKLGSGETQPPFGSPGSMSVAAGDCGDEITVDLKLIATEVDFLKNDTGEHSVRLKMKCPDAGDSHSETQEISVGVVEVPAQMKTAVFTLKVELTLSCQ